MFIMRIDENIIKLKGIGEKTVPLYEKIGVSTIDDLIHYYPRDYVRYEKLTLQDEFETDVMCAFTAVVVKRPLVKKVKKLSITTCTLQSGNITINATWFHMPFLNKMLIPGKNYVFRGILQNSGERYRIEQAQIFAIEAYEKLANSIAPLYPLTKGLSNNALTKSVRTAFDSIDDSDYEEDLLKLHFPKDYEELTLARSNLVFEEFLLFILRLRFLKEENEVLRNDFNIIEVSECQRLIERLPYRLTNAQLKVWAEICADLTSNKSMCRLVQGDVGSGKTILAILSAIMVAVNGYQAAVMAPTEILATQHFEAFCKLIKDNNLDIDVALLTGSISESKKKGIRSGIESGKTKIIVGTHALIQEKVIYNNLALVVTDEQHRFGVNQRELLSSKNQDAAVHVLVMSATPIPRTLAIIMYGDLSISIIDEVPSHKLPIKNAVVDGGYRQKAYDFIIKEVKAGHQAYVICPLVEESEGMVAKDVVSYSKELSAVLPDDINIGCLHGKMRPVDKQKVMSDFADNNVQVLVATTVVEVGVNVPNATVMLIEDADRFGLAQLHQLRGRIGRGSAQSYCIFMSGSKNKKTIERLDILKQTNDGFKIAEEDLKQRGPGDLFGIRQSGDMQFKLADVFTDASMLKKASEEADRILAEDPELMNPCNAKLRHLLEKTFSINNIGKTL